MQAVHGQRRLAIGTRGDEAEGIALVTRGYIRQKLTDRGATVEAQTQSRRAHNDVCLEQIRELGNVSRLPGFEAALNERLRDLIRRRASHGRQAPGCLMLLQGGPCAVQSAVHTGNRRIEQVGYLSRRETYDVVQNEHRSLARW